MIVSSHEGNYMCLVKTSIILNESGIYNPNVIFNNNTVAAALKPGVPKPQISKRGLYQFY